VAPFAGDRAGIQLALMEPPEVPMRRQTLPMLVTAAMVLAGCASNMSPEAKLRNDVFWEAATQCESKYRTLHLDRIDIDGGITMHADAETRSELQPFKDCYRQAVKDRIEKRQKAGLPIPAELNVEPTVDLD
jgi:hypothetical protein